MIKNITFIFSVRWSFILISHSKPSAGATSEVRVEGSDVFPAPEFFSFTQNLPLWIRVHVAYVKSRPWMVLQRTSHFIFSKKQTLNVASVVYINFYSCILRVILGICSILTHCSCRIFCRSPIFLRKWLSNLPITKSLVLRPKKLYQNQKLDTRCDEWQKCYRLVEKMSTHTKLITVKMPGGKRTTWVNKRYRHPVIFQGSVIIVQNFFSQKAVDIQTTNSFYCRLWKQFLRKYTHFGKNYNQTWQQKFKFVDFIWNFAGKCNDF